MIRQLPWSSISVAEVKEEADHLREGLRTLNPEQLAFATQYGGEELSANGGVRDLSDEDCGDLVAASYGFVNWRQLVAHLISASEAEEAHPENQNVHFQRYACLAWFHYEPAYIRRAEQMLGANPHLDTEDIYTACATGNYNLVEWFLEEDPDLALTPGGFFGWEPLLYACNSRLQLKERSTLQVARILLEKGADPNTHFMWGGSYRFTALTGAFGEGEAGPVNYPAHHQWEELAELLLSAGADPNDGQALYNRMFTDGHRCLEMLLEAGLNSEHRCNWFVSAADGLQEPSSEQTLHYQLQVAITDNRVKRAHLLIDHGAEITTAEDKRPLYETAMLNGHPELARKLAQAGAEVTQLTGVGQFASTLMAGLHDDAEAILASNPRLLTMMQHEHPELLPNAAAANRLDVVQLAIKLGADLSLPGYTMLHAAAWHNHLDLAALLIDAGAATGVRDSEQSATPLQWARHAGNVAMVEFLNTCEIDIFDAVVCSNTERLRALATDQPELLESTRAQISITDPECEPHPTDWMTPLAFAASRNELEAAEALLNLGANPEVSDPDGNLLADLIAAEGPSDMLELLTR